MAVIESRFADLAGRLSRLDGRLSTLTWMTGANLVLTLLAFALLL